jgi:endoglucanase
LRIPFSAEVALGLDTLKCKAVNTFENPSLNGCTAGQMFDQLMEECRKRGILVMPDLHRFVGVGNITELWYDDSAGFSESKVIEAWLNLVRRYAKYPNFFAVDLKNEPHGKATWGSGNLATDWDAAAKRIGNAILKVNPKLLIVVEGVEIGPMGDNSWWGGTIAGLKTHPITLDIPNKLVYSPHVYGPSVFPQPYFSESSFPSNLEQIWDRHFGFSELSPFKETLLIGEFGGTYYSHNKDDVWQNTVGDYFAKRDIDWFYWCVNPNSGDTKGLLDDDWKTPVQAKLDLLKKICPNPTKFLAFDLTTTSITPKPPVVPTTPSPPRPPTTPAPATHPTVPTKPSPPSPPPTIPYSPTSDIVIKTNARESWIENNETRTVWDVTITNKGKQTLSGKTKFKLNTGRIHQIWNVQITANDNTIIGFPEYLVNTGLLPANDFNFGFISSSTSLKTTVSIV